MKIVKFDPRLPTLNGAGRLTEPKPAGRKKPKGPKVPKYGCTGVPPATEQK